MKYRQVNTTNYAIPFLLVSQVDGITPATGLAPTIWIKKVGGSFAVAAGAITEDVFGWYSWAGNATDRNTLGPLVVHASGFNALPWDDVYSIVPYDPFLNVVTVSGTYDKSGFSIAGSKTTLDALNDITTAGVWNNATRTLTTAVDATGVLLTTINTNINNLNNLSAAQVWAHSDKYLTRAVDATGVLLNSVISNIAALNDVSAAEVWSHADRYLTRAVDATGALFSTILTNIGNLNDLSGEDVWTYNDRYLTRGVDATGVKLDTILSRVDVTTSSRLPATGVPANFDILKIRNVSNSGYIEIGDYAAAHISHHVWNNGSYAFPGMVGGALYDIWSTRNNNTGVLTPGHLDQIWSYGTRSLNAPVAISGNYDKTGYSIAGTKTTLDALNDISASQARIQASGALTDYRLNELMYSTMSQPHVDSMFGHLTEASGVGQRFTRLALSLGPTGTGVGGGSSLTASDVWGHGNRTLTSFNFASDATGVLLNTLVSRVDTTISSRLPNGAVAVSSVYDKTGYSILGVKTTLDDLNDASAASIWTVGTRSLTTPVTTSGVYDKAGYSLAGSITTLDGLNNLSATEVWTNPTRDLTRAVDVTGVLASRIDVALSSRQPSGVVTLAPTTHTGAVVPTVSTVTNGVTLATSEDIYYSDIQFTKDGSNSRDEYTVSWFKNGAPVTASITSPQIQVIKRSDGTDLIAATNLTQIGSTAVYKYDESSNRTTNGEAYIAQVTATIDGSNRTWRRLIARDAS